VSKVGWAITQGVKPPYTNSPNFTIEHVIYLWPIALSNKYNFLEGVINELIGVVIAEALPSNLEIKKRSVNNNWGWDGWTWEKIH
jgi:hypothetical protein